jgi:hypothetical protein
MKYLPDESDWNHIDKKWLCDILYTKDTDPIKAMIKNAVAARRERYEKNQNQLVEMRPEFAEALRRCDSFSCRPHMFLMTM